VAAELPEPSAPAAAGTNAHLLFVGFSCLGGAGTSARAAFATRAAHKVSPDQNKNRWVRMVCLAEHISPLGNRRRQQARDRKLRAARAA
jgi:hypothetical protein